MPIKFVDKHMVGFMPVVEASEGYLLGGRMVCDGPVFERFFDALKVMNAWIEQELACDRKVKLGKVVLFEGMASCTVHVPDKSNAS